MKKNVLIIILIIISFSCNRNNSEKSNNLDTAMACKPNSIKLQSSEKQAPTLEEDDDFIAKYVCPIHCNGSGSDKQGICSNCGMELIENLDYSK